MHHVILIQRIYWREIIRALNYKEKNYMSFFVSCGQCAPGWQIISTNKIGLRFSTIRYDSICCPPPLNNWAHLYTDSIISDTLNWTKISGSTIADSAYKYLGIGNFFDDNHTDTLIWGGAPFGSSGAYYYIDDVCVSTDSLYNESWTGIANLKGKGNLKIFPNPVINDYLNIENVENTKFGATIYDATGRIVIL